MNIIAWGNTSGTVDFMRGAADVTINYSIVETAGNYSGTDNYDDDSDPFPDPKFNDYDSPKGDDGLWFTSDDGYLIQSESYAVDRGAAPIINDASDLDGDTNYSEPFPYDILLQDRTVGVTDMGVNEIQ